MYGENNNDINSEIMYNEKIVLSWITSNKKENIVYMEFNIGSRTSKYRGVENVLLDFDLKK